MCRGIVDAQSQAERRRERQHINAEGSVGKHGDRDVLHPAPHEQPPGVCWYENRQCVVTRHRERQEHPPSSTIRRGNRERRV